MLVLVYFSYKNSCLACACYLKLNKKQKLIGDQEFVIDIKYVASFLLIIHIIF